MFWLQCIRFLLDIYVSNIRKTNLNLNEAPLIILSYTMHLMHTSSVWQFGLQHFQGDHVNEHDPDGAVQHLLLVLHQGHRGDALGLQLQPLRVLPLQLPVHVLLELLHIEKLERFFKLKKTIGKF